MNIDELKELLVLVSKYNFSKFEMNFEGNSIKIERNSGIKPKQIKEISVDKDIIDEIKFKEDIDKSVSEKVEIIKSTMVGVLYNSKAPDFKPFIKVGDKIKKGQVVCLIESVKIINEVRSEYDGVVEEICVPNKGIVEFGEPLIKVRVK
ncbi:MAG: hypothetical protein E7214_12375 [Clostridium sp.]|nr:hypothetical protein [Clostridium sp.]